MKIAFHTNQLSLRGTEVSMYDYAKYNKTYLGNESIVIAKHPDIWNYSDPLAIQKFENEFEVYFYRTIEELQRIIKGNNTDVFYVQKAGVIDDVVSNSCKTVVHAVFQHEQPHGDVYAYISKWLSELYGNRHPYVPYMVDLPNVDGDMREVLNIPHDAIVYGRHGGYETFDYPEVQQVVVDVATKNPNIYFLFLNTEKFTATPIKNIIHLEPITDLVEKRKFINTCDAMIHGRKAGESFGLAIAEFSICNKPVLTCGFGRDTAHIAMLGNKGIYYDTVKSLTESLVDYQPYLDKSRDWNAYREFSPEAVMDKFKKVFLD